MSKRKGETDEEYKERVRLRCKEYYQRNKDSINAKSQEYYAANKWRWQGYARRQRNKLIPAWLLEQTIRSENIHAQDPWGTVVLEYASKHEATTSDILKLCLEIPEEKAKLLFYRRVENILRSGGFVETEGRWTAASCVVTQLVSHR